MAVSKINRPHDATVPNAPKAADKSFKDALKASARGGKETPELDAKGIDGFASKAKKELDETHHPSHDEPALTPAEDPSAPSQSASTAEPTEAVVRDEKQFGEADATPPSDEIQLGDDPR
ncbi:MAG: hypothetical protein R3E66_11295 [bacterium]